MDIEILMSCIVEYYSEVINKVNFNMIIKGEKKHINVINFMDSLPKINDIHTIISSKMINPKVIIN